MVSLASPGAGRAQALLATDIILLVLPYPLVALRFWSRWKTRARIALNDYLIVGALVVTTGFNINIVLASIFGGYGQHVANTTPGEIAWFSRAAVVSTVTWPTANALIKLSILHFYTAIFFVNKKTVVASYALAALTFCFWLGTFITAFTFCRPFAANWNKTPKDSCGDVQEYSLSTAIVNLMIDMMIVVLPLPSVWALQMATSRKIALTFVFGLGAGICAISIVRVYSIATLNSSDITYNIVLDNVTTTLELVLGIVNACLPILQPVVSVMVSSWALRRTRGLVWSASIEPKRLQAQRRDSHYAVDGRPEALTGRRQYNVDDLTTSLREDDDGEGYAMTRGNSSAGSNKDSSVHSTF